MRRQEDLNLNWDMAVCSATASALRMEAAGSPTMLVHIYQFHKTIILILNLMSAHISQI
jgi:hypothetical protein